MGGGITQPSTLGEFDFQFPNALLQFLVIAQQAAEENGEVNGQRPVEPSTHPAPRSLNEILG